ncbi:unnamed protein product [Oppiella nova]|uniref:Uncharacterized protein n=1 Tax=Oppiella nova TaxID=334625 RepID=A0A7R9LJV0_9ACAR|nr:unnamed protein product [Oppiella nova]CAG2164296.1 unnamed protein product [Oppiella nova]
MYTIHESSDRQYYTIDCLSDLKPSKPLYEAPDGQLFTVQCFYSQRYGIELTEPDIPCIRIQTEDRDVFKQKLLPVETKADDTENQLNLIIGDLESRDRTDIERFCSIIEGTVVSDLLSQKRYKWSESLWFVRLQDMLSIPKALSEPILTIRKARHPESGSDVYPMSARCRGYCVIIDNQLFHSGSLRQIFRKGSRADAYRLSHVFRELHFRVRHLMNKTAEEMVDLLEALSDDNELYSHNALVVIILSHGNESGVEGTDRIAVPIEAVLEMFNNENCPKLVDKPKVFFINACRGATIDPGLRSLGATASEPAVADVPRSIPTWSDMFVYFSTVEGYVSPRNPLMGSWFGYELAHCLAQYSAIEHLNDLMTTIVAQKLHNRESKVDSQVVKQALETLNKGRLKKLYFNPVINNSNGTETDSENVLLIIIANIESRGRTDIQTFGLTIENSGLITHELDRLYLNSKWMTRLRDLINTSRESNKVLTVQKAQKLKSYKSGDVYPMTRRVRGFCIIINNQSFADPKLSFRSGSRADAYRLSDVFSQLGFDVHMYDNQTSDQMKKLLMGFRNRETELSVHEALVVIILSHGREDGVHGSDGQVVPVDTILRYFNNNNCPVLFRKPKMFFISACRGGALDRGVFVELVAQGPQAMDYSPRERVPMWSDMFVYYSAIQGYVSPRNKTTGSWFGYELAHCLAQYSATEHLNDLMTIKVAQEVDHRISQIQDIGIIKTAIECKTLGVVKKVRKN